MPMEDTVRLRVMLGTRPSITNIDVDFFVVNAPNNMYNAILERMSLKKVKAIVLALHLLMEFPTPMGIN